MAEYLEGTLSDYARIVRRDSLTLSKAVSQIREELERDLGLLEQMRDMRRELDKNNQITKAWPFIIIAFIFGSAMMSVLAIWSERRRVLIYGAPEII